MWRIRVNCRAPNYCGMRKFVDTLPLLNTANNLGNMLPVAVPDTNKFPGSDYYEISLVQYRAQLHSDLPAVSGTWPNQTGGTLLRGYVQTNGPLGTSQVPYYLGPVIISQTNRPVRVKFTNALPTGAAGNLFIPTDLTALGAGLGLANGQSPYLQNRATVHLHGGNTPWISDGTPHQWTIPAGDWISTKYQRGASVSFVPDMYFVNGTVVPQCSATVTTNCSDAPGMTGQLNLPAGATNDPGAGALTFYYTNQQSGRLLFYHDHAYGTTRLNVYAGEAGAMLITDNIDADLTNGTNASGVFTQAGIAPAPLIPAEQIPLVIQDKSFVPQNFASTTVYSVPVLSGGEGYTTAAVSFSGGCTTEPTATANIGDSVDDFGQLIFGTVTDITLVTAGSGCTSDPIVSITGDGAGATAFASDRHARLRRTRRGIPPSGAAMAISGIRTCTCPTSGRGIRMLPTLTPWGAGIMQAGSGRRSMEIPASSRFAAMFLVRPPTIRPWSARVSRRPSRRLPPRSSMAIPTSARAAPHL